MSTDHAAVRRQVLDHLLRDPFNLETDTLEESAKFISEDLGLPTLIVLAVLRELKENGQIQNKAGGYVVLATPPRKRPARKAAQTVVPRTRPNTTGEPNAASPPTGKGRRDDRR